MPEIEAPELTLLFRPDAFFLKPWRGWGVVRDAHGRSVDRYTARGEGRTGSRSAAAEQVFTFDSGLVTTVQWDILSDDEGHYYARDLKSGIEARGQAMGPDFRWSFSRPAPGPMGALVRDVTTATYTMATPTTAFSFTETRRLSFLIASFTTFYEQL